VSIRRSRYPLLAAAIAFALSGCESVTLRPRSVECTIATVISPVGCQPMERAADTKDEEAKRFTATSGKANLYVVRPSIVGGRYAWLIQVDGKPVGAIAEHTFLLLAVEPGRHEIAVQTGENRHALVIDTNGGENRFIEVVSKLGWTESRAELRVAQREQGETAVLKSKRVDAF
jgi:hypothetical protein